jgi:hypothetical protein
MKIKSLCLISLDSWYGKSLDDAYQTLNEIKREEVNIATIRTDGARTGSHSFFRVDQQMLPEFCLDKTKAIYLRWENFVPNHFLNWVYIVNLLPNTMSVLLTMDSISREKQIDSVFKTIFPSWEGEHINVTQYLAPKFISILYIEPEELLFYNTDNLKNDIKHAINTIPFVGGACQPNLLDDIILLFGLGASGPDNQVTVYSIRPLPQSENVVLSLPKTVMELLRYMNYIHLIRYLSG